MPHIDLPPNAPGILGPMTAYPRLAQHLNGLAQALLRGPSSLTPADRELIATSVSSGNECYFCTQSHAAVARELYGAGCSVVDELLDDAQTAPVPEKLRALLAVAEKVRQGGRQVSAADIDRARKVGADDEAIHDTVLIAAAFCMFNRYVDGLATWAPAQPEVYKKIGERLAIQGYMSKPSDE